MTHTEAEAVDLLVRLVEDRDNTLAGVAEDCHGTICVYCGVRGYKDRPRPNHRRDCPVERGQDLLDRLYGDGEARGESGKTHSKVEIREIPVSFPG